MHATLLGRCLAPLCQMLQDRECSHAEWASAWLHHTKCQDHHLEHWRGRDAHFPPYVAVEMLVDSMAASWGYQVRIPHLHCTHEVLLRKLVMAGTSASGWVVGAPRWVRIPVVPQQRWQACVCHRC